MTTEVVSMPQQRLDEIEFYNYIKRLLDKYENSIFIYDLVDVFAATGNIIPGVIKKLIQQIHIDDKTFVPSRTEQLVVYRKKGYSMRQIRDITGIHPNTQYKLLEEMQSNRAYRPSIAPRLDQETYNSVKIFMNEIKKFKEV